MKQQSSFSCALQRRTVMRIEHLQRGSGIGGDDTGLVLVHVECSSERQCPDLYRCPMRQDD